MSKVDHDSERRLHSLEDVLGSTTEH